MKTLKNNLPIILFVLFELIVGILLLAAPEKFTAAVITVFGAVILLIGAVYLIRFFRDRRTYGVVDYGTLLIALLSLIMGSILAFLTEWVMGLFAVIAVIYGIILIISGIYKIKTYSELKTLGVSFPLIMLLSALISVVLGLVIVFNPFGTITFLWRFTGVSLIIEALLDALAVSLNAKV